MTTIHLLGQLENRADTASAVLAFLTGCGLCCTREAVKDSIWDALEKLGSSNPPAALLARTMPMLWEEIQSVERTVCEMEQAVYDVLAHRCEPSVN